MFKRLKFTNFRQHEDAVFEFAEGLNVLRGANEKGKSTIIEGILYLLFGSRALSESLAETVTYGKDEKTLRVEGEFCIDGIEFTGYRSKSGAELVYGDQRVTGQTECTQFIERLLRAKADTVRKLMIAEQNSVRGILMSEGKSGELIENLANLGLIEELVDKIQNQLPSGPTKAQEQLVYSLNSAIEEAPEEPSVQALSAASYEAAKASLEYDEAAKNLEDFTEQKTLAEKALAGIAQAEVKRKTLLEQAAALQAVEMPAPCEWTEQDFISAKQSETDAAYAASVEKQRSKVFKSHRASWSGTEETAEEEIKSLQNKAKALREKASQKSSEVAAKLATKINEGVCSFCKLDISQRPEVVDTNAAVDSAVAVLREEIADLKRKADSADADAATIAEILAVERANMRLATAEFWKPVDGDLPRSFEWIGPKSTSSLAISTPSSKIRSALDSFAKAVLVYESAQQSLKNLQIPEAIPEDAKQVHKEVLSKWEHLSSLTSEALAVKRAKLSEEASAKAAYESEMKVYELKLKQRSDNLRRAEDARQLLQKMVFNNDLIKDLRDARSQIRKKLWQSVTALISVYFTRIRQVDTVISQGPDGFLQNGKPIAGLSGSAKDMLGLAVRASLIKTFIPGAPLMVVDEPFSGCDDNREMAGIGVLSGLEFTQTILVTHSDLADSVANKLIQL